MLVSYMADMGSIAASHMAPQVHGTLGCRAKSKQCYLLFRKPCTYLNIPIILSWGKRCVAVRVSGARSRQHHRAGSWARLVPCRMLSASLQVNDRSRRGLGEWQGRLSKHFLGAQGLCWERGAWCQEGL